VETNRRQGKKKTISGGKKENIIFSTSATNTYSGYLKNIQKNRLICRENGYFESTSIILCLKQKNGFTAMKQEFLIVYAK